MSLSSIVVTPGGKSLTAYHQERAVLYAALLLILDDAADDLARQELVRRLSRLRGAQHRARPLVEHALRDPDLEEERAEWLGSQSSRPDLDLEALSTLAHQAAQCARALGEADVAAAADLWDAQSGYLLGPAGVGLQSFAIELMGAVQPVLQQVGRALHLMLEDDLALAGLEARSAHA